MIIFSFIERAQIYKNITIIPPKKIKKMEKNIHLDNIIPDIAPIKPAEKTNNKQKIKGDLQYKDLKKTVKKILLIYLIILFYYYYNSI